MAVPTTRSRERGARTRAKVLVAAEEIFARDGYDAARMEDISDIVGIHRAGLFYYFKDKAALYEAVLDDVLGELMDRLRQTLAEPGALRERIEECAVAWVEYVWNRPSLARILLREGARSDSGRREVIGKHTAPLIEMLVDVFDEGYQEGVFDEKSISPLHFASTIIGTTVFLRAAFPSYLSDIGGPALTGGSLQEHCDQTRRVARFLLDLRNDAPRRKADRSTGSKRRKRTPARRTK